MIIDAHAHVWSSDTKAFPWAPHDQVPLPEAAAPAEQLLSALESVHGVGAVCLQPRIYGYDHGYLNHVLGQHRNRIAGVCLVNPVRADGPRELRELVLEHGYRGLRLNPMADPDPDWLDGPRGRPLWEAAAELQLVVSLLIQPEQLYRVAGVARALPDTPVVIDHLGRCTPDTPAEFTRELVGLSDQPNVWLKVSALSTLAAEPFPYRALHPLIAECYRAYGAQRLLWGTDFPHILADGAYRKAFDAVAADMPFIDESDLPAILGNNTARLYRLAATEEEPERAGH